MCDLPVKQQLAITGVAATALEDKVAGVRKNAISLIVKLIVIHLYGLMHGGLLGMQELEERYRDVMTGLQKTEKALDQRKRRTSHGKVSFIVLRQASDDLY